MAEYDEYVWIVVVGAIMAFFMAYGIGANDVANAFATSVGSKTLTLFQATILAGIFEFAGALLLGRGVTKTIRKGMIDADFYEDSPEILMYGMLCALTAAGVWLIVATYFELPVSTTHSIIGGLVGWSLVARGGDSVIWHKIDTSKKFPIKGISSVVISWVFSPVASGLVAVFFFVIVRALILRSDNSFDRAFLFLPVLVLVCIFINAFYVLDKGIDKQVEQTTETSAWVAAIVAVACAILSFFVAMALKGRLTAQAEAAANAAEGKKDGDEAEKGEVKEEGFFSKLSGAINSNNPHAVVDENDAVKEIHDNAEVFEEKTEFIFRYLQVLTSCCDAFAHGANDVANSIGPFSAIWAVYSKGGDVGSKSDVPIWILFIGGFGIVLGLGTYGYSIIKAIGVKMTKITPSRGFTIELGSALVVVTGSYLGLPLSTTHCQVGATVAVGLAEGAKGVSWTVFSKAIFGWIFTLIIVGAMSALFMALGIFTPNIRASDAMVNIKESVGTSQTRVLDRLAVCNTVAGFEDNLVSTRAYVDGVAEDNFLYPNRAADVVEYMTNLHISQTTVACNAEFTPVTEVVDEEEVAAYIAQAEKKAEEEAEAAAEEAAEAAEAAEPVAAEAAEEAAAPVAAAGEAAVADAAAAGGATAADAGEAAAAAGGAGAA